IDGGRSQATTMGFTALDGLVMGTRPGALDPGALLYLLQSRGMDAAGLEDLLYHCSGLLGGSGISSDMRALLASDDPGAGEGVELFVYRVGRELGSLAAVLGGLDALVFTAGIGEHAPEIRARICRGAAWLGIGLDEAANRAGGPRISPIGAHPSAWGIPTNEDLLIARHTAGVLAARGVRADDGNDHGRMRRSFALALALSIAMTFVLWAADVSAKSAGGGFRSGSRAARDDGGSGMSQGQSPAPGMDPTPDAPTLKKPRRPPTLYGSIRQLLLGGPIGSLFLGHALRRLG